jgi:signal transduction histidine kinase
MRYSLSEDLPEIVADERSLKQVLINLVSNAIKFTNGGGQVILSTRLEEDGSLAIRVRDTGEGMDAEQLQIALQPFRQVSKKENVGGTGLGLPLSKALAEANHASFDIESEKNKGTTVSIIFAAQHVCANEKGKDKS